MACLCMTPNPGPRDGPSPTAVGRAAPLIPPLLTPRGFLEFSPASSLASRQRPGGGGRGAERNQAPPPAGHCLAPGYPTPPTFGARPSVNERLHVHLHVGRNLTVSS